MRYFLEPNKTAFLAGGICLDPTLPVFLHRKASRSEYVRRSSVTASEDLRKKLHLTHKKKQIIDVQKKKPNNSLTLETAVSSILINMENCLKLPVLCVISSMSVGKKKLKPYSDDEEVATYYIGIYERQIKSRLC